MRLLKLLTAIQNKIFNGLMIFGVLLALFSIPYVAIINPHEDAEALGFIIITGLVVLFWGVVGRSVSFVVKVLVRNKDPDSLVVRLFLLAPLIAFLLLVLAVIAPF